MPVDSSPGAIGRRPGRGDRAAAGRPGLLGVLLFATQPILLNAVSIPVMAYIIRRLGPTAYGEWSAASSLIFALTPLMNLGLRGHYVRSIAADPSKASDLTADQFGLRLCLGLVGSAVAVTLAIGLRYPANAVGCTAIAGVGLILGAAASTSTDLLQASGRLSGAGAVAMSSGLVLTTSSALAVGLGAGPIGLSIAYLSGPLIWATTSAWMVRTRSFPLRIRWNARRFREYLREARFFAAQQVVSSVSQNAEALLTPAIVGMGRYGVFSAGLLLASRLMVIPDGLATALFPIVSRMRDPSRGDVPREIGGFLTLTLSICVPLCILCQFLAGPIAGVLMPGEATLCGSLIRVTVWALPIAGVDMILGCCLNAAGMEASQARVAALASGLSLVTSVVLIGRFGLMGAASTFVLRPLISLGLRSAGYRKTFGNPMTGVPLLRIAACSGLLLGGLAALHPALWPPVGGVGGPGNAAHWALVLVALSAESAAGLLIFIVPAACLGVFSGVLARAPLPR